MDKLRPRLLALFTLSLTTIWTSSAQIRSQIDLARDMITANNCDAAIIKLEVIEPELQNTPDYLLTKALAHDCKGQLPEAIYFYKRYLEQKNDDSARIRYETLIKKREAAQKAVEINEQYRAASGIKHKKRAAVGNGYLIGFSTCFQIPVSSPPYAYGILYSADFGFPLKSKKVSAIVSGGFAYYGNGKKKWMQKMTGSTYQINEFDDGWGFDLTARLPYWLKNSGDVAWGLAPMIGYKKIIMNNPNAFGPDKLVLPKIGGATLGLEAVLALNYGGAIYLGYSWYKVDNPALALNAPKFSVNFSSVTLKLSYGRWRK